MGMLDCDIETLFRLDPAVVIMCKHVPQNKQVIISQQEVLRWREFPVRGTEQLCLKKGFAAGNVFHISCRGTLPSMKVVVGVVANGMPLSFQSFEEVGISSHIGTQTKKGGFHIPLVQDIEDSRGDFGHRAVIKCQVDLFFGSRDFTDEMIAAEKAAYKGPFDASFPHGR